MPKGVGILTAGVDILRVRAEITVLGFGLNNQIWVIDHKVLYGDPDTDPRAANSKLWIDIDRYLNRDFKHEGGRPIQIETAFIDVGDAATTKTVRRYCFDRMYRKVFAIVGSDKEKVGFSGSFFRDGNTKHPVFKLGVNALKTELFHRLQVQPRKEGVVDEPTGYIHFPRLNSINDNYFNGLLSEKLVVKNGQKVWIPKREGIRNEALDCFGYALAAFQKEIGSDYSLLEDIVELRNLPFEAEKPDETEVNEVEIVENQEEKPVKEPEIRPAIFDFYANTPKTNYSFY